MKKPRKDSQLGFSILELVVAMSLGVLVMAAMASLFKSGMNATVMVEQRAELQQDLRAGIDLMVKDISLAGAGLPTGIQLPVGGTASKFGCDQSSTCYVANNDYPSGNFMYGVIPNFLNGVQGGAIVPAAPAAVNDAITVIYADYNFPLWEYSMTFQSGSNGGQVNAAWNTNYTNAPPAINAAGGIQKGDLIMINGGGAVGVGEVTNVTSAGTAAGSSGTLFFANSDPLNINQSGATSNNLKSVETAASYCSAAFPCTAYRLYAVTYYLMVPGGFQTPRLMRQVNGLTPVPVADDIVNLQFTYDTFNTSVTPAALDANQANPIGVGESPNNIQKVNIWLMGQSINNWGNKSQNISLATSVSANNLTFRSQQQY